MATETTAGSGIEKLAVVRKVRRAYQAVRGVCEACAPWVKLAQVALDTLDFFFSKVRSLPWDGGAVEAAAKVVEAATTP